MEPSLRHEADNEVDIQIDRENEILSDVNVSLYKFLFLLLICCLNVFVEFDTFEYKYML